MPKTTKAVVTFYKCIQDKQEYGSDKEFMVSRVFFNMQIGDSRYNELYADLKQTVGSNFEAGSIEVKKPSNYNGPFNYTAFRSAAEQYFRNLVGSQGRGIHIEGGKDIRMYGNIFEMPMTVEFDVDVM